MKCMKSNYRQKLEAEQKKNPFISLVDAIYTIVLDDILSYKYANGSQLKEAVLAEDFGVSRTPIRAVMNMLTEQGFLTKEKNKAAIVTAFTPQEKKDLIAARFNLEPLAMAYAASRITDSELSLLNDYMQDLSAACASENMMSAFEYENKFHDYIIICSHNNFIIKQYNAIKHYFYQSRMFFTANNGFYEYYIHEHQLLLAALHLHDENLAQATMIRHLSVLRTADEVNAQANPTAFYQVLQGLAHKGQRRLDHLQ